VRGNLLDLEHNWQAATTPTDAYLPPPTHLRVVWKDEDGLPYFDGATPGDVENMDCFGETVASILSGQKVRLRWHREQWQQVRNNTTMLRSLNLRLTNLLPAYTLLYVPRTETLRPRRPRYDHSHLLPKSPLRSGARAGAGAEGTNASADAGAPSMNHPPVKVKWPKRGRESLRDFIVEALLAENVQAWAAPWFDTGEEWALAVVTAPWFADAADPVRLEDSFNHGPIKHKAVAISKLDYYLFARSSTF
jgi:hypothetical protein